MMKKMTEEKTIKPKKEIAIVQKSEVLSVESFISQAIASQLPIKQMERLFSLRKEVKAEQANEAFIVAMSNFQAECPIVEKKKEVKSKAGATVYFYAPLDSIVEQVSKTIAKNGLAYTFDISSDEKELTATCKVTHNQGHSETFTFKVPIGSEAYMTEVQKFGARATFAKRNAFCNAFGIMTGDEDTDATQTDKAPEAKEIKAKIMFLLKALEEKVDTIENISSSVKKLTSLSLDPQNYSEIKGRLEVLLKEKNEYDESN
jgi:hypothetical protein